MKKRDLKVRRKPGSSPGGTLLHSQRIGPVSYNSGAPGTSCVSTCLLSSPAQCVALDNALIEGHSVMMTTSFTNCVSTESMEVIFALHCERSKPECIESHEVHCISHIQQLSEDEKPCDLWISQILAPG